MSTIDFWFEFASTYSYPAALRIEEAAKTRGLALRWRPFLLGPIFKAQGWNDSPFNIYPVKGRYMWRDMERLCDAQGIPLRRPSRFPRGSLPAARLVARFADESAHASWIPAFVSGIYRANFAEDADISDPAVVVSVLESVGQPASVLAEADSNRAKAALRANTDEAMSLGIFGAPSFVTGGELFWGNDRLDAALDWAAKHEGNQHGSDPRLR